MSADGYSGEHLPLDEVQELYRVLGYGLQEFSLKVSDSVEQYVDNEGFYQLDPEIKKAALTVIKAAYPEFGDNAICKREAKAFVCGITVGYLAALQTLRSRGFLIRCVGYATECTISLLTSLVDTEGVLNCKLEQALLSGRELGEFADDKMIEGLKMDKANPLYSEEQDIILRNATGYVLNIAHALLASVQISIGNTLTEAEACELGSSAEQISDMDELSTADITWLKPLT